MTPIPTRGRLPSCTTTALHTPNAVARRPYCVRSPSSLVPRVRRCAIPDPPGSAWSPLAGRRWPGTAGCQRVPVRAVLGAAQVIVGERRDRGKLLAGEPAMALLAVVAQPLIVQVELEVVPGRLEDPAAAVIGAHLIVLADHEAEDRGQVVLEALARQVRQRPLARQHVLARQVLPAALVIARLIAAAG